MTLDPASIASLLVVAPHPDDETIGAGGLAHAVVRAGGRVRVVVVSDGAGSHPGSCDYPPARLAQTRQAESRAACVRLGVDDVRFCGLPDGGSQGWPSDARGLARLEDAVSGDYDVACLPSPRDNHADHRMTRQLARPHVDAARVLDYLVWPLEPGNTVEAPAPGPDITYTLAPDDLAAKRDAMQCYRSQLGLITDSPDGFSIDTHTLARFTAPVERFTEGL